MGARRKQGVQFKACIPRGLGRGQGGQGSEAAQTGQGQERGWKPGPLLQGGRGWQLTESCQVGGRQQALAQRFLPLVGDGPVIRENTALQLVQIRGGELDPFPGAVPVFVILLTDRDGGKRTHKRISDCLQTRVRGAQGRCTRRGGALSIPSADAPAAPSQCRLQDQRGPPPLPPWWHPAPRSRRAPLTFLRKGPSTGNSDALNLSWRNRQLPSPTAILPLPLSEFSIPRTPSPHADWPLTLHQYGFPHPPTAAAAQAITGRYVVKCNEQLRSSSSSPSFQAVPASQLRGCLALVSSLSSTPRFLATKSWSFSNLGARLSPPLSMSSVLVKSTTARTRGSFLKPCAPTPLQDPVIRPPKLLSNPSPSVYLHGDATIPEFTHPPSSTHVNCTSLTLSEKPFQNL